MGIRTSVVTLALVRLALFPPPLTSEEPGTAQHPQYESEARAAHQAYWRSLVTEGSDAALERFYSEDFTYLGVDGKLIDKPGLKARMKRNQLVNLEIKDDLKRVSVYGNVALITGHSTSGGRDKGQEHRTREGYIEVWVKRDGQWKLVAEQLTPQK